MPANSQLVPAGFSLAAVLLWGTSDFIGGYAVRRANAFVFTAIVHGSGMAFMLVIVGFAHATFPRGSTVSWALAAGVLGGLSLAVFYRALAAGNMGIMAPVSAVLSAAIPAVAGIIWEGLPGMFALLGFALAGLGLWLVSRSEDSARPAGLGLAILAGVGFAGFYVCIRQAGTGSALWIALLSRVASFAVTAAATLFAARVWSMGRSLAGLAVLAGCIDVSGSVLFIRASQTGRLDVAVVLSSLYPAVTVLLAWIILKERLSAWKLVGVLAALAAVPLIAAG